MQSMLDVVLSQAASLSPAEVKAFRFTFDVVRQNARFGMASVAPHHETLKAMFITYVPAEPRLTVLLDALHDATLKIAQERAKTKVNLPMVTRIWEDRAALMPRADTGAAHGLVDPAEIERIHAGAGPIDAARDIIAIAALAKASPEIKAKMFGADRLDERVARAHAYLRMATPSGTAELPNLPLSNAIDHQARLWTLVLAQHAELWRHAANIFGREADAHVPALNSRLVTRHANAPVEPAPALEVATS